MPAKLQTECLPSLDIGSCSPISHFLPVSVCFSLMFCSLREICFFLFLHMAVLQSIAAFCFYTRACSRMKRGAHVRKPNNALFFSVCECVMETSETAQDEWGFQITGFCSDWQVENGRASLSYARPPASPRCLPPCFGCTWTLDAHETPKRYRRQGVCPAVLILSVNKNQYEESP